LYPKRGYGQISEALATAAEVEGADIRLRNAVTRIDLGEDDVRVETEAGDQIEGRMLFSSLPITGLVKFCSNVPAEVTEAAQGLSFRSMILVYLVLESARYSEYDAHYFPEEWTQVTRVSEPKNYRSGDDPSDRTVLCAEIPCDRDDATWSAGDDALRDAVVSSLERAGLPEPRPIDTQVYRLPYAYPIYDLEYERRFDAVDAWSSSQPRLITFGRQGLFVHDNAHHALAMAWEATERLGADGEFDHAGWARARERFKLHVVED
jgi:protoporphyrinogen oxidase